MKSSNAKAAAARKPSAQKKAAKPAAKKPVAKAGKPKAAAVARPAAKAAPRKPAARPAKQLKPASRPASTATKAKAPSARPTAPRPAPAKPEPKAVAKPKLVASTSSKPEPKRLATPAAAPASAVAAATSPAPVAVPAPAPVPSPAAFAPAPEARPAVAREVSPAFAGLVPGPLAGSPISRPSFMHANRPATPPIRTPVPARPVAAQAASNEPVEFAEGDHVVYPTHGVGKVVGIVNEEIAGHRLQLIVVTFDENRMTLRVPVAKARSSGLRKLANRKMIDTALSTLKGRARIKRTMWSRRAQEYEAKINSGDPIAIAEVVRDLHRNAGQPDQSFSERQIYEAALDRLASEIAAIDGTDKVAASEKLAGVLKTA